MNITDWIKYELFPNLFEKIDIAFPEFEFERKGNKWVSSNKLKITGEFGDSSGKVNVWEKSPHILKDYTRGTEGLIDYVIKRDHVDFLEAITQLASITNLKLPDNKQYNKQEYKTKKEFSSVLEEANSYFIFCLQHAKEAEKYREYLSHRGYSPSDIIDMELGFIPSQEKLYAHLKKKEFNSELIQLIKSIGSTHQLTIPYKTGGQIKGFKFRTIDSTTPKYINSTGLEKNTGFFNLQGIKGDKDIVIVEGELDALHATVKGIENVVATGGNSVNKNQVQDAIKRGGKSFTICLDNEPHKSADTIKTVQSIVDTILNEGITTIYVAELPNTNDTKTDPDSLIKEKGIESFQKTILNAFTYYKFALQSILNKYSGEIPDRTTDKLLDEVVSYSAKIKDPLHKDRYKSSFLEAVYDLGITEESINITVEKLTSTQIKEEQTRELTKLIRSAQNHQSKGDLKKALNSFDKIHELKLKDKVTEFNSLKEITDESHLKKFFRETGQNLSSGFEIDGRELLLPSGALTGIAGGTGHGKTDMLINMTLNCVEKYPTKEFYFFSYEMSQEAILVRFLNSYLDMDLNSGSNQRSLKYYLQTNSTEYIRQNIKSKFEQKKQKFFDDYIATGRLRVKGIDYFSGELIQALDYLSKEGRVGGYFIDYFQLLRLENTKKDRQKELKDICQDLNALAKKIQLPIVLGAQFNREVTTPFKLHATKVGEAGDIERILDTLIGIWNTNKAVVEKDLSKSEITDIEHRGLKEPNKLYVYLLKSRDTESDIYTLLEYNGKRGKIRNTSNYSSNPF